MLRTCSWFLLPVLLTLNGEVAASPVCATTIKELERLLDEPALPQTWAETTMDDGRPLVLSIVENNGSLLLGFTKTGEGLWAESSGAICRSGSVFEARFSAKQIRIGPAAGWILRSSLKNGGKFTLTKLDSDQLRIATSGWSGEFSPVME